MLHKIANRYLCVCVCVLGVAGVWGWEGESKGAEVLQTTKSDITDADIGNQII